MGARFLVATLLLGGTLLFSVDDSGSFGSFTPTLLLSLIALTYGLSLGFALWLPRTKKLRLVLGLQLAWDVILATGLVYVSGGVASAFTFLYGISILMAAIIVGPRATQVTAAVSLIVYTVVGISVANGWVPHPPDQMRVRYVLSAESTGFSLLSNIVGLLLVALLAGNLANRIRRAGGQLRLATRSAVTLARLNDDIVRSLTSGLITTDLEGSVLTVNPAGAQMFGAEPQHLIGRSVSSMLPISSRAPGPTGVRDEGDGTRVDGNRFPVGCSSTPLVDADGSVIGTLTTFQDLTELADLRRTAERAEHLAVLGRLGAGLAHEIRNPLSSISGSVELVRESKHLLEEDRQLLGIVVDEVGRLDELVTNMLQLGRPKAPEPTPVDLAALVEDVAGMARRGAGPGARVSIELERPKDAVRAHVDPDQARQVVWNLVKNAVQASPPGGTVTLGVEPGGDDVCRVWVQDQGEGITESEKQRLFEAFFSGRSHGVGLGLALVRQIVDAHHGSVEVTSAPGEGARFTVTFPALRRGRAP